MYKMTKDELVEWEKEQDRYAWSARFYTGMKYSQNYQRYHPIYRFDILWAEFLDLYEPPEFKK